MPYFNPTLRDVLHVITIRQFGPKSNNITFIMLPVLILCVCSFAYSTIYAYGFLFRTQSHSGSILTTLAVAPSRHRTRSTEYVQSNNPNLQTKQSTLATKSPPITIKRNDNIIEKLIIGSLTFLLAFISHELFSKKWYAAMRDVGFEYKNFVMVTKALITRRDKPIAEVSSSIVRLLNVILPPFVKEFFKKSYQQNPKFICTSSSLWYRKSFLSDIVKLYKIAYRYFGII